MESRCRSSQSRATDPARAARRAIPTAAADASPSSATSPADLSDEDLLARLARQEPAALEALWARHGRTAYAVAYGVLGSAEAAEDCVQEAFVAVWRRAASYAPGRGSGRTWLLTVVRHRAIDLLRARESRPRTSPLDGALELEGEFEDSDPARAAIGRLDAVTLRRAVAALPAEQRQVIDLAYFAGLSYPEIAARTNTPLGTVKSRLRLALLRLRTEVGAQLSSAPLPQSRPDHAPAC